VVFFFYLGVYCIFAVVVSLAPLAGRAGDFALVVLPYVVSLAGLSPQDRPRSPFPSFFFTNRYFGSKQVYTDCLVGARRCATARVEF
jgi:hypothetical protein